MCARKNDAPMKRKIVISRLKGGLGNQMFQYAFGRALSARINSDFYFETGMLDRDVLRSFALTGFCISAQEMDKDELSRKIFWPDYLLRRFHWLPTLPGHLHYVAEKKFSFDADAASVNRSVCLDGYWQSPKYFEHQASLLRQEFQLKHEYTADRKIILDRIKRVTAVSVHVRRGDYVSNPTTRAFHGLCSLSWYKAAMQEMSKYVDHPYFFVFSDDPKWCHDNIVGDWPIFVVDPQDDSRDFEDMHLISECQHHIISNSSFSWWGAWLNQKPGKRVIAPRKWFNQSTNNTEDLIPMDWQRL